MSLYAFYGDRKGKPVPAYKLETDVVWMTKKEDNWMLPDEEIKNKVELKKLGLIPYCSFVKSHTRDGNHVRAHFRKKDERVETYDGANENEEHKLAKDAIY